MVLVTYTVLAGQDMTDRAIGGAIGKENLHYYAWN